jgi:hypothetical protein
MLFLSLGVIGSLELIALNRSSRRIRPSERERLYNGTTARTTALTSDKVFLLGALWLIISVDSDSGGKLTKEIQHIQFADVTGVQDEVDTSP